MVNREQAMAPGFKTGGRKKGSKNKPKPRALTVQESENVRLGEILQPVRTGPLTPKALMLEKMQHFDDCARAIMDSVPQLIAQGHKPEKLVGLLAESRNYNMAAIQCADRVAPYVHGKIASVDENKDPEAKPFVVRAPDVIQDSTKWERQSSQFSLFEHPAPMASASPAAASGPSIEEAPVNAAHVQDMPAHGSPSTQMPLGPRNVAPSGSQAWLEQVALGQKTA
jgi:hypothetical protein